MKLNKARTFSIKIKVYIYIYNKVINIKMFCQSIGFLHWVIKWEMVDPCGWANKKASYFGLGPTFRGMRMLSATWSTQAQHCRLHQVNNSNSFMSLNRNLKVRKLLLYWIKHCISSSFFWFFVIKFSKSIMHSPSKLLNYSSIINNGGTKKNYEPVLSLVIRGR